MVSVPGFGIWGCGEWLLCGEQFVFISGCLTSGLSFEVFSHLKRLGYGYDDSNQGKSLFISLEFILVPSD